MAIIVGLYFVADVWQHKGQARVLFPKNFPEYKPATVPPVITSSFINTNKEWRKGINNSNVLNKVEESDGGFECDVYFDSAASEFDIYHDPGKSTGQHLHALLEEYEQKKMKASIWLDIKNLSVENVQAVLATLIQLRNKFNLQDKILVESHSAGLLNVFSDSGFYTSWYLPMFNPYLMNEQEIMNRVSGISASLNKAGVNALSGYYFQSAFCSRYFPNYPFLTWIEKDRYSLVNRLFRAKISGNKAIYIALDP